jgi:putative N6-adenine-specific DNA methylase
VSTKSKERFELTAKTSFGFEDLLVEELKELGAENIRKATRAVMFEGDLALMYKANLWSRVSLRILKPIATFPASSEQMLYEGVKRTDWSQYLTPDDTLAVDAVVSRSHLTHTLYIAQKTKDGIVDQLRNRLGTRPDVDTSRPTVRVNVHISQDIATISLDSSGESLHKRGYRQQPGDAPLNETLAAGMVLLSGWDKNSDLYDPMCGSGTILIEAALIARNIAPGSYRKEFGFERWNDFDMDLWNEIVEEAKAAQRPQGDLRITGTDKSIQAIRNAVENARAAGLERDIDLISLPFEDYMPDPVPKMIITNPPYGGRITDDDLFGLYKTLGDTFKKRYQGATAWVLTANREAAHKVGLHPSRKIPLFNGALECRFMKYEMYSGSRKAAKSGEQPVSEG